MKWKINSLHKCLSVYKVSGVLSTQWTANGIQCGKIWFENSFFVRGRIELQHYLEEEYELAAIESIQKRHRPQEMYGRFRKTTGPAPVLRYTALVHVWREYSRWKSLLGAKVPAIFLDAMYLCPVMLSVKEAMYIFCSTHTISKPIMWKS